MGLWGYSQYGYGKSSYCSGSVFFSGTHIGKLETVSGKLTECPDISRWNKRCLNNIKMEKIRNPFCVTFIRFLPFMALTYLGCVRTTCICVSRMLKTGIQYLPVDSMQTATTMVFLWTSRPAQIRCFTSKSMWYLLSQRAKRDISIDCHPSEKTYHGNRVSRGIMCQSLKW